MKKRKIICGRLITLVTGKKKSQSMEKVKVGNLVGVYKIGRIDWGSERKRFPRF